MSIKFAVCDQALPGAGIFAPRIIHDCGLDGMSIEMGTEFHGFPIWQKKIQEYYILFPLGCGWECVGNKLQILSKVEKRNEKSQVYKSKVEKRKAKREKRKADETWNFDL